MLNNVFPLLITIITITVTEKNDNIVSINWIRITEQFLLYNVCACPIIMT
jgi:uncharacterized membrane protein YciS (DUF1049 family)